MGTKLKYGLIYLCIYFSTINISAQNNVWNNSYLSSLTSIQALSNDGDWLALTENDSINNLKLINTKSNFVDYLGNIKLVNFIDNYFIYINANSLLTIKNLTLNKIVYLSQDKVDKYEISPQKKYIAIIINNTNFKNIKIIKLEDFSVQFNDQIIDYKWEGNVDKLACISRSSDNIFKLKIWNQGVITNSLFNNLIINPMKFGFFNKNNIITTDVDQSNLIYHFDVITQKVDTLDLNKVIVSNNNVKWIEHSFNLYNQNEFIIEAKTHSNNSNLQYHEWNTQDTVLPLWKDKYNKLLFNKFIIKWKPIGNQMLLFNSSDDNVFYNFPQLPYILRYNYFEFQPSNLQYPIADLYLVNKNDGSQLNIVNDHNFAKNYLSISPTGNYIVYFKNLKWYYYDYKNNSHKLINIPPEYKLHKENDMYHKFPTPYGIAGWSEDENLIFVYEKNNIISFNRTNGTVINYTNNQSDYTFRFNETFLKLYKDNSVKSNALIKPYVNNKYPILLDITTDSFKNGIGWLKNGNLKIEFVENFKFYNFNTTNDKMFWIKENYKSPPTLESFDLLNNEVNFIYQSNPILNKVDFGYHQIIPYKNHLGEFVNGVLLYPSNFDKNKKYPIIFNIYENMGYNVNEFNIPTDYNLNGFNILKYILNGYFIFLPHFTYQIGNPSKSIIHNIESSIKELDNIQAIDKTKMGLIGHSFGGYEAALIATKSNLFKAIVAGAGVMDLISFYNDFQWETGFREQKWRIENQQFRMGNGFYQDKENYINNSPFHQIDKLNTPLFLWTGKKDYNINWYQSVTMFGAMRNLNKTGKLLIFDNEGHFIINPENQIKLSNEIYKWFGNFLK